MADEYISKQDAKDALQEKVFHNLTDEFYGAMQVIDELPPADVVSVVRCKDCKHRHPDNWFCGIWKSITGENGYCNYGERREE